MYYVVHKIIYLNILNIFMFILLLLLKIAKRKNEVLIYTYKHLLFNNFENIDIIRNK